ncbi:MAG: hypothetical protein WCI60_01675 [bacterium]
MTTNTILQLARFNSTDTPSSSEWVTNLKEPVILNQGDSISVRQAYVDSRLNSSGSITIEVDTPLSLTYYFYMMFPCDGASRQVQPAPPSLIPNPNCGNNQNFGFADVAIVAPIDYVNFVGTLNQNHFFEPFSGALTNDTTPHGGGNYLTMTGQPQPPIGQMNQAIANEIPMLLVEYERNEPPLPPTDSGANINLRPITRTWTYTLKAGTYNPNELADLLTKKMAEIQTQKTAPSFNPYSQFGTSTPSNLNDFLIRGTSVSVVRFDGQYNNGGDSNFILPYSPGGEDVTGNSFNFSSNSPAFADAPLINGVFSNFCSDITLTQNYLNNSLVNRWNLESQKTNPLTLVPSHWSSEYTFTVSQNESGGNWDVIQMCGLEYETPIVGASEISLEFNSETGLYQFTYMHTPILQLPTTETSGASAGSQPIEVVKIIKTINIDYYDASQNVYPTGEVNICEQSRHSGIIWQSMEPKSFWQDVLGFDVDNITFAPDYIWGQKRQMTFQEFNNVTTSGYVGIENNFNFVNSDDPQVLPNTNAPSYLSAFPTNQDLKIIGELTYTNLLNSGRWFLEHYILKNGIQFKTPDFDYAVLINLFYEEYASALIATNPLVAIQAPLSQISSTGHYLINIDDYKNTKNDFINENSIYNIKAIVSNYYLSQGSFATMPFNDSAIYVHNSPIPKVINSFRVRLIDPLTMGNATNIGPNSSVYLQCNKVISDVAIAQTV